MKHRRKINLKAYFRAMVALALIVSWSLAALTGFLLWVAPRGPGAGRLPFLLGLTRPEWGHIHFLASVAALGVTIVHVVIDWQVLCRLIRYLISVHRHPNFFE